MKPWHQLPNDERISWLIEDSKRYPTFWIQAWNQIWVNPQNQILYRSKNPTMMRAHVELREKAWVQALKRVWEVNRNQVWVQTRDQLWEQEQEEIDRRRMRPWACIRDAFLALIAYDDCGHMLDMPGQDLVFWARVSDHPAAWLLLPAVRARELVKESHK